MFTALLFMSVIPSGAAPAETDAEPEAPVFTHAQLNFLAARRPWTVGSGMEGVISQLRVSKDTDYGHPLIIELGFLSDGMIKVKHVNIYAVPLEDEVYWLDERDWEEFQRLDGKFHLNWKALPMAILIASPLIGFALANVIKTYRKSRQPTAV